jgi:hypothetical protein
MHVDDAGCRDQVRRLIESEALRSSEVQRRLLSYLADRTLAGEADQLKEYTVGIEALGRPATYDPRHDSSVRFQTGRLRQRLADYYRTCGNGDPVLVELPRGHFKLSFTERHAASVLTAANAAARNWRILSAVLLAAFLVAAAATVYLAVSGSRQRRPAPGEDYSLYRDLFGTLGTVPDRETLVVLSNPKVASYYGWESKEPLLEDPANTILAPQQLKTAFGFALNSRDRDLRFHFLRLSRNDYTGIGEAVAAFHLGRLMQLLDRRVRMTQGRFLSWDHVQKQDLILVGGPQSNDWTYQNDAKSNFSFGFLCVENLKPLPGEQARYEMQRGRDARLGGTMTDYAVIKMLTSPYGFKTLLLAGMSSAGTAGAGQFLAAPEKMRSVYDRVRMAAAGKPFPSNWEVLIKVAVRDSLPVETSAIAFRPAVAAR